MPEISNPTLSGVTETLLITLYIRAMESQRADPLIKDKKAEALLKKIGDEGLYDFNRLKSLHLSEANKLVIVLRNREFDRYTRGFLARHPNGVVVHIGCGLDTRFERVDNGQVEYDLDFPEVIELRKQFLGDEKERYHLLACSVLDEGWLGIVSAHRGRPFLFVAEGVSMHLKEEQVRSLVTMLYTNFPGAEFILDAHSPLHNLGSNLQTSAFGMHCHWGIWHGEELEKWAKGIHLLGEWGFFDSPDSRLSSIRWLRHVEELARTLRIYHFQLG